MMFDRKCLYRVSVIYGEWRYCTRARHTTYDHVFAIVACARDVTIRSGTVTGQHYLCPPNADLDAQWYPMQFQTRAVHAGREPDPATGAVTQPIVLSTTFERATEAGEPH